MYKGSSDYYKKGSYNFICYRCSQKRKREEIRPEWTGVLVCYHCWEPKHPWNEPLPVPIDGLPVPDAGPRNREVDIDVGGYSTWDNILPLQAASDFTLFLSVFFSQVFLSYSEISDHWSTINSSWSSVGLDPNSSGFTINWENADVNWENT